MRSVSCPAVRISQAPLLWCAQAAMQLDAAQRAELAAEADAMTQRLRGTVKRHKALLLDVCKAPLTASGTRPDTPTVRCPLTTPGSSS